MFFMECQHPYQELNFISKILFYCEDEDDVKRLEMRLLVDRDKYHKVEKVKHSWI